MIRKVVKSYEDYSSLEACIKAVLNILNEFEQRISDLEENKIKKTDEERIKELNQRAKKEKTKAKKLNKRARKVVKEAKELFG